jgi:hypothetical protein
MTKWYPVESKSSLFDNLEDVQVVFHGINKSGSKAMSDVLRRALSHGNRSHDALSHYHMNPRISLEELRDIVDNKRGRVLVATHNLYGYLRPRPRRIWATQFRHPLPRVLSVFHWLKKAHVRKHGTAEGFYTFPKFLHASRGLAHSQVTQLSRGFGRYSLSENKKRLPAETLYEMSIEALERDFTAIGIAERFEESIYTFAALLGIVEVESLLPDDRNKGRPFIDTLTQAERDLVREIYHWDYRLYDWALKKFEDQCSRIEFGPSLQQYKKDCSGQYKDRLIGSSADDAVARWLTQHWREGHPEPKRSQPKIAVS